MKRIALIALLLGGSASAQIPGFTSTAINFSGNASSQALDPAGNIWIADPTNAVIGKIELPSETYTAYPVPAAEQNAKPYNIAVTPDGAVWYTDYNNPVIGRRSIDGNFTLFPIAAPAFYIAASPDNSVCFSFFGGSPAAIGYLSTNGHLTSLQLPIPNEAFVESLTVGPDGAAWFTDLHQNHRILRVGLDGAVTSFPVSTANPPNGFTWAPSITTGPDGNIWFTHATAIGRLRLSDDLITEYPIPYANADASGICTGGDGNIWYADSLAGAGVVGQLVVSTATDDGHATINASPGIGEPIGIIPLGPAVTAAPSANVIDPPRVVSAQCGLFRFGYEKNQSSGANLGLIQVTRASVLCADLEISVREDSVAVTEDAKTFNFSLNIVNNGPDPAVSPVLVLTPLTNLNVFVDSLPLWNCVRFSTSGVACRRTEDMPSGLAISGKIGVVVGAQFGGGLANVAALTGTLWSSTPDPTPSNVFSVRVNPTQAAVDAIVRRAFGLLPGAVTGRP